MVLHLYRRHRRDCTAGHAEDSRSSELEERRKGWKRCDCPIFATGTFTIGNRKRKSTGQWEWTEAKALAGIWEARGNWGGTIPEPPQPSVRTAAPERITIFDATEAFVAKCQNRGIALPTLRKYKTFTKQLNAYAAERGYIHIDQLTVTDMDRFYASWKDAIRAKAKKLERLKAFVKFCQKRKWLSEDIADDLQAPEGSSIPANKTPFTDDELKRIYAACDAIGGPKPPGPGKRPWGGEDVKDFILLSVWTGLRISDVAMFDITKRLHGNDVFLRMHKTKKELYTWIPDWLVARLRDRQKKHGAMIFKAGQAMNVRSATERWRENLAKVFVLAGPWDVKPTPHKCRHTFIRMLLEKGVPVQDVATLAGDTVAVIERYYSNWMPERQKRLSNILKAALDDKPRPTIVEMPKLG